MANTNSSDERPVQQPTTASSDAPKKDTALWAILRDMPPGQFWALAVTVVTLLSGCWYLGYRWADASANIQREKNEKKIEDLNISLTKAAEHVRVLELKVHYLDAVTNYYFAEDTKDFHKDLHRIDQARERLVQVLREWWPDREGMPRLKKDQTYPIQRSEVIFLDNDRFPIPTGGKQSFHEHVFRRNK
jgi:hypothetical protein